MARVDRLLGMACSVYKGHLTCGDLSVPTGFQILDYLLWGYLILWLLLSVFVWLRKEEHGCDMSLRRMSYAQLNLIACACAMLQDRGKVLTDTDVCLYWRVPSLLSASLLS